jgi:hypothetical protein
MKNCPKRYEGQALAISMIVLVVCAVLGISIYSRVVKDRTLVLNEKISAEALEIADSVLDSLSTIPASTLQEQIEEEGFVEVKGWSSVNTFLDDLGLSNSVQNLDICQQGNSSVDILVEEATIEDLIETRPNEARAYHIGGKSLTSPCGLRVHLESRGTVNSGVIVRKIYGDNYATTPDYKIYEEDDIEAYCFSEDLSSCNSDDFSPDANWIKIADGGILEIDLTEVKSGYSLDEVRIIPIGGVVGIAVEVSPNGCMEDEDLGAIRIVTNVTCQDIYRAKEVFVPDDGAMSFSSLFDHVVYNNIGLLDL